MNEKIETKPITLTPFKRFCMTIGELPSSYLETMSYYEMLLWFTKYLGETVIPAINNNAEAVTEVQNLFLELQDYVNNYFDNLNIQNEINNKLDDMAESGQLVEIIGQYLETSAILGFDTKADLKGADNLIDGSITKTLGDLTYGDGKGQLYKIRTKTELDVTDDDNILALTNFNDLVAEKIINYDINTLQTNVSSLQNSLSMLTNKKYLFIGDSYATGYQGSNVDPIEGFFTKAINDLNLTAQIVAENGYGFLGMENNHKWLTLLQNTTINNKDTFTDIIIIGGMNDSGTKSNTITAMEELITYLKSNFVNATIHIGMAGKYRFSSDSNLNRINELALVYKATAIKNGCKYIAGSELILHNTSWFISDNIHPNTTGEKQLAYGLEQYIVNGKISSFIDITSLNSSMLTTINPAENTTNTFNCYSWIDNETTYFTLFGAITFTGNKTISNNDDIIFGSLSDSYVCGSPYYQGINQFIRMSAYTVNEINGSHYISVGGLLYNDSYGNIHFKVHGIEDNGGLLSNIAITELAIYYEAVKFDVDSYRS